MKDEWGCKDQLQIQFISMADRVNGDLRSLQWKRLLTFRLLGLYESVVFAAFCSAEHSLASTQSCKVSVVELSTSTK